MNGAVALYAWARLLIDGFVRAGVTDAVICPGSRSTPFAWTALQHPGLQCTSLLDERSAGFFALGQASVSGQPSLVICTSGTAAANLLPAAVEANTSLTPLLLLTADRPFELDASAAPQTIDQVKLYGAHVRAFFELGEPAGTELALRAVQRKAAQAALCCRWPQPGPVHLNARAAKPLDPPQPGSEAQRHTNGLTGSLLERGPTRAHPPAAAVEPTAIELLARACRDSRRGLVVCGPMASHLPFDRTALCEVIEQTGFPLLCEASSQLRFALPDTHRVTVCDGFDTVLRSNAFRAAARAEVVIQLGQPPTSGGWAKYLQEQPDLPRHLLVPHPWPDPLSSAATLHLAQPSAVLRALVKALALLPPAEHALSAERQAWQQLWHTANSCVWRTVAERVGEHAGQLTEAAAVRAVTQALPRSALLAVGNSLAIREVDTYCPGRAGEVRVWVQRGANGIDGVVSGSAGAALRSGRPTTVLLGDVSFLHDIGGLWAARKLKQPFVLVVLNNDGGRIFEQLPLADRIGTQEPVFEYWLTSHGLNLARAGPLYDLPAVSVDSSEELAAALEQAHSRACCTLIEARVGSQDARHDLQALWREVDRCLSRLCGDAAAREPA